jgi:hypothetical protein
MAGTLIRVPELLPSFTLMLSFIFCRNHVAKILEDALAKSGHGECGFWHQGMQLRMCTF